MSSLAAVIGAPVVSRTSAEELGAVHGVLLDEGARRVVAWQLSGRRRRLVDHEHVTGIGAAAVIVDDEASLRNPHGDRESAATSKDRALLGALVLSVLGNRLGNVADVEFDDVSGEIRAVLVQPAGTDGRSPAGSTTRYLPDTVRAFGSYALVLAPDSTPATAPTSTGESR